MARKKSIAKLAEEMEPRLARVFLQAVARIKTAAQIKALEETIARGDFEATIRVLRLDEEAFADLAEEMRRAYIEGGRLTVQNLPPIPDPLGGKIPVYFGGNNLRAEAAIRERSSTLITELIIPDQREGIMQALYEGQREGRHPRQTALDLVGRIGPGGRRTGGIVGLHSTQIDYASRAYAELRSGDPQQLRNYLNRKTRNKRYDGMIERAIQTGKPIPEADADRMIGFMRNKLLQRRGEAIARTETRWGVAAAQDEAIRQQIDSGKLKADQVTRVWDATGDARTRPDHMAMEEQRRKVGEPFTAPDGQQLMFPCDGSLGADGKHTINCRCVVRFDIDFYAGLT